MTDALTSSTLWGALGLLALAAWAVGRLGARALQTDEAMPIVAMVAIAAGLAFAVCYVLEARFAPWRVVLGVTLVAAVAVVAWTIVEGRGPHTSGRGAGGLGILLAFIYAMIAIPLLVSLPAAVAWLAHRHPPTRLAWGILLAVVGILWLLSAVVGRRGGSPPVAPVVAPPPPAPYRGPTLRQAIAQVRSGQLPVTLGRGSPAAVIDREQGAYVLFELRLDEEGARKDAEEGAKRGYYVPEMLWRRLGKGKVLASAATVDDFVALLERDWRADWGPVE